MFLINDIFVIYNFINPSLRPADAQRTTAAPARLRETNEFMRPRGSPAHEARRQ